jgi:hypothetical protein
MKKLFNTLKKSYQFLTGVYQVSKNWIVENGITGVAGLILGLILWSFGYKIWAGFPLVYLLLETGIFLKTGFLKNILIK